MEAAGLNGCVGGGQGPVGKEGEGFGSVAPIGGSAAAGGDSAAAAVEGTAALASQTYAGRGDWAWGTAGEEASGGC